MNAPTYGWHVSVNPNAPRRSGHISHLTWDNRKLVLEAGIGYLDQGLSQDDSLPSSCECGASIVKGRNLVFIFGGPSVKFGQKINAEVYWKFRESSRSSPTLGESHSQTQSSQDEPISLLATAATSLLSIFGAVPDEDQCSPSKRQKLSQSRAEFKNEWQFLTTNEDPFRAHQNLTTEHANLPTKPKKRYGASLSMNKNDTAIYLFGGTDSHGYFRDVWKLHLEPDHNDETH